MKWLIPLLIFLVTACRPGRQLLEIDHTGYRVPGTEFYERAVKYSRGQFDSAALHEILSGNMPAFLRKLVPVRTSIFDSTSARKIEAVFFVTPDYLCIGTNANWARVPLTPMASQRIADSFDCFLPTRKIVDDIYRAATVKLEPIPLTTHRDSAPTMRQHHLRIEEQRNGRPGLVAGIKKDVVITSLIGAPGKRDRVAIYGWHRLDGKPIQPLYTGHVNWYVDYSHGTRLVHRTILVDGRAMDFQNVLSHPVYARLLSDEIPFTVFRYPLN